MQQEFSLDDMKDMVPRFFNRSNRRFFGDYKHEVYRNYLVVYTRLQDCLGKTVKRKVIYRFTGNDMMHVFSAEGDLRSVKRQIDNLLADIDANSLAVMKRAEPEFFENYQGDWFVVNRYAVRPHVGKLELWFFNGKTLYCRGYFNTVAEIEKYIKVENEHKHTPKH